MELPEEVVNDLSLRLRRAEGQVRAVETMLSEGRECRDIVTQFLVDAVVISLIGGVIGLAVGFGGAFAGGSALEQVGFRLIASGLTYCVQHPEEAEASGYPLDEVQRLFIKLA